MSDNDDLFHVIDDAHTILRRKGIFRQAKLYRRAGKVYAGVGAGYVRLMTNGGTSQPDTLWEGALPARAQDRRSYFEWR